VGFNRSPRVWWDGKACVDLCLRLECGNRIRRSPFSLAPGQCLELNFERRSVRRVLSLRFSTVWRGV